jgi:hypothetical protein
MAAADGGSLAVPGDGSRSERGISPRLAYPAATGQGRTTSCWGSRHAANEDVDVDGVSRVKVPQSAPLTRRISFLRASPACAGVAVMGNGDHSGPGNPVLEALGSAHGPASRSADPVRGIDR